MDKKEKQTNSKGTFIIGMDIHPDVFTAVCIGGPSYDSKQLWLDTDVKTADYQKWLERRAKPETALVFEAGSNAFEFAKIARENQVKAKVIDSRKIGQIRKAYCENDKLAARKIAKAYLSGLASDSEVWQPDEITRIRRQIISAYDQATKNSTRSKNQIRSFLNEAMVRLPKSFGFTADDALARILKLHDWNMMQQQILAVKLENLKHAVNTRNRLLAIMVNEVKKNPFMRGLMQLCGIRALTAFALVAAIGNIERFDTPKKLVSYIGLTPGKHQSGNSEKSFGITKYGIKALKAKIIQAAQAILRSKCYSAANLRNWGIKLTYRKGKNKAVAAVARKLIVAVWYQMRGLMPVIMDEPKVLREKIRHIVNELNILFVKALGYKSKNDFFEEFWFIINSRT